MEELYGQLDFAVNPQYEKIISDILENGYSIVDDLLSESTVSALRTDLLEKYEDDLFKKAAIGNRLNEVIQTGIRGDFILWMDESHTNDAQNLFFDQINDLASYLNRTCFLGILRKEFHYAVYPEGKFYERHLDTFQNDDRRKLSIVCYLNEDDWQPEHGGELVLYLNGENGEIPKTVYPFPGRAVIFESRDLEHEVKPAKRERLSITGWLKTR
ncbi:oxidoreductase [Zobellia sp. OII3]|uniref:2OG-Fe(II) oxygenase n=1 Tax=Zobellia sp. OII3 TaxID=2034520 RepID=UPI000B52C860|nr:2OG-Fe(II) oxygenase [Zobellia sp. OII3]OWW26644.1 oxidoreductase [Zobellia sp. OII3]